MREMLDIPGWMQWFGATVVAVMTFCAFSFGYFESKADALDKRDQVVRRLESIQQSIEHLSYEIHKKQ